VNIRISNVGFNIALSLVSYGFNVKNRTFVLTKVYILFMKINLKSGVGQLLFGMKEKDVKAIYGEPSRQFKDDDNNTIYLYNKEKIRLTFYADEDFKLGYLIAAHPDLELFSIKVLGQEWESLKKKLEEKGVSGFERETYDSEDNLFNEANWIIFRVEFGEVIRVELGATINNKDEFDWKF
jgi:hypothetical protein